MRNDHPQTRRVNQLIADGIEFSVAIDTVVFETKCDRDELIKAYDDDEERAPDE